MPLTPQQQMQAQQCVTNLVGMGAGTFAYAGVFDKQTGQFVAAMGARTAPPPPPEVLALGPVLNAAGTNANGVLDTAFTVLAQPYTIRSAYAGSNPLIAGQNQAGGYCLVSRSLNLVLVATIASLGAGVTLDGAKNLVMAQIGQLLANGL